VPRNALTVETVNLGREPSGKKNRPRIHATHYRPGDSSFRPSADIRVLAGVGLLVRLCRIIRADYRPGAEKDRTQKLIQLFASFAFIGAMILPSLDHRFSWSAVPPPVVVVGDVLVALGFLIVFLVFKENTFTAATIEVAPDQRVISTGPYAIVRHPMYSGALLMLLGTPLALGSWWGLLMFIPMLFVIAWRAIDEERFLLTNLRGYEEYCQLVRYRLVPFVW